MPDGVSRWFRSSPPRRAAECVVVDLRSRHVPPLEARRRAIALASDVRQVHKIDSTLRGNWAAELSAFVEIGRRVVLIPSHPPLGRVCVGGVVLVDGVPVAETEHGNDPRMPVRTSRPRRLADRARHGQCRAARRGLARRVAGRL